MKKLLCMAFLSLMAGPAFGADTLYDDLGGKPGIDRIVDASVDNYLADPRIADIFSESNIDRIRLELMQGAIKLEGPNYHLDKIRMQLGV